VIGAGITGLSTALHLSERKQRVCLLEAHEVGHGGSGRNVGLVNAGLWLPPDDIEAALGKDVGNRLNHALGDAPALVFSLIERLDIACQSTRTGTLHIAPNRRGLLELTRRFDQLSRRGAPVSLLTGPACHEAIGSTLVLGALLDRRAGTIDPMAFTRGLARAAMNAGVRLYQNTAVKSLQREGTNWRVVAEGGSVTAAHVVIASNAYTEGDWTRLPRSFFAGYFYQVASRPLPPEHAARILPGGQGAWDTRLVLSSLRKDRDGRLIIGSLGNGQRKPTWFVRAWADRVQGHYFPYLDRVEWEYTWTGRMAFTSDHTPRLLEPAKGLLAVTGYNGRGITTGTVIGKAFSDYLVTGDRNALPIPLTPARDADSRGLRGLAYEAGFSLYHAGQCLRVLV